MSNNKHEIDASKFYSIGKWVMFGVAIITLAGAIDGVGKLPGVDVLKSFLFSIFYLASTAFFSFLHKTAVAQAKTDDDLVAMNEALKAIETNSKSGGKK